VAAYLPVDQDLENIRQRLDESLWYLGRIQALPEAKYQYVKQTDWAEAWKVNYHPIAIGRNLMIVPAWLESPDENRIPIQIDPGMAFGTGTHPTTQLCLELISEIDFNEPVLDRPARNTQSAIIDIGCGSGILAIAALKLGASSALAVDIDPEAVDAARQNAALNEVTNQIQIELGSLAEVRAGQFSISSAGLVVANILAPVLATLLDEGLGELLTQRGKLILSGILQEQATQVEQALERNHLRLVDRRQSGDWVALLADRGD
jgi:ribosomal protein L11 methyltransferase